MEEAPWMALTDPAWFACANGSETTQRKESLRGWPSCPNTLGRADWGMAVWQAMASQTTLWGQLAVHDALTELQQRAQPLDATFAAEPLPAWLSAIHADIQADGAQRRRDQELLSHWQNKLMGPVGVATLRTEAQEEGSGPIRVHGAPLPVALAAELRTTLVNRSFLNARGERLSHRRQLVHERRAKVLRGVMRWIDRDLDGEERAAALLVAWAAAVWHRDRVQYNRGQATAAREHLSTAVELADGLLAKRGVTTPAQRLQTAERALSLPWGEPVRVKAAETLASSLGFAWPDGSERVWAQAMAVLGGHSETHWNHMPDASGRHLLREGIAAATSHLQDQECIGPRKAVAAMVEVLPPRWVTELLAQVWVSAGPCGSRTAWGKAALNWLAQGPADDTACWTEAVLKAWRDEEKDGPRLEMEAAAKDLWLRAAIQTAADGPSRGLRPRL